MQLRLFGLAGIITGLIPLMQPHSFVSVGIVFVVTGVCGVVGGGVVVVVVCVSVRGGGQCACSCSAGTTPSLTPVRRPHALFVLRARPASRASLF